MGSPARALDYGKTLAEGAQQSAKPFYLMTTRSASSAATLAALLREHGIAVVGGTRAGLGAVDRLARWSEPLAAPRPSRGAGGAIRSMQRVACGRPSTSTTPSACSRQAACRS